MDTSRQRRVRAAAIEAERENREDRVRRVLAEARRNVGRLASAPAGGLRYSEPVEMPSMIFKTHDPSPGYRRSRRTRSEPAPAAAETLPSEEGIPEWQVPWERWLRAHLDQALAAEREHTNRLIVDAVRQVVDGVIAGLENVGEGVAESNRELREQLRDLRLEVARLGSVAAELQSNPVDLPVRSLRSLREVN
jgi:hypothetical protein